MRDTIDIAKTNKPIALVYGPLALRRFSRHVSGVRNPPTPGY